MEIKYVCPVITVADIVKSREFYENVLKQELELIMEEIDLGRNRRKIIGTT